MRDQFSEHGIILDNALAFWVYRVNQALRNEMFRVFREHGHELTPEQWVVLVRLWEREGRTQTDLCDSTHRDRPTMSRILDGMESRGLIERRASAEDARARLIFLTKSGRALEGRLVPLARQIVEKMIGGIPDAALETTRRTLRRMFDNLEPPPCEDDSCIDNK